MKYKNLDLAYSLEIIIGLITAILIILISPKAFIFLAILSLRPFILDKEKISYHDEYWHASFKLGRDALMIMSVIILCTFILIDLLLDEDILFPNSDMILTILVPAFLIIHGILGIFNLKGIIKY
jgi:hypothetical protein